MQPELPSIYNASFECNLCIKHNDLAVRTTKVRISRCNQIAVFYTRITEAGERAVLPPGQNSAHADFLHTVPSRHRHHRPANPVRAVPELTDKVWNKKNNQELCRTDAGRAYCTENASHNHCHTNGGRHHRYDACCRCMFLCHRTKPDRTTSRIFPNDDGAEVPGQPASACRLPAKNTILTSASSSVCYLTIIKSGFFIAIVFSHRHGNKYLVDTCSVHVDDFKTEAVPVECFTAGRDMLQFFQNQAS